MYRSHFTILAQWQRYKNGGDTWQVQVRRRGKALSATFDTKAEAEHWAIRAESQIFDGVVPQALARRTVEPVQTSPILMSRAT